jgi:molecular chaperone GrpE
VSEKADRSDPVGEEAKVSPPTGEDIEPAGPTDPVSTAEPEKSPPAAAGPDDQDERPTVVVRDKRKVRDPAKAVVDEPKVAEPAADDQPKVAEPVGTSLGAELEAMRHNVDELTRDLQRMTAEYANYRKRVDRDRGLVGEQAVGTVLVTLLPVLDDIDRAREHGDLVGPFGSVAEQLVNALTKFGLTPFGEKGDKFDPTRHEAVAHQTSSEVEEPTCVGILRRGYLLGERLLRPALVAVADPE